MLVVALSDKDWISSRRVSFPNLDRQSIHEAAEKPVAATVVDPCYSDRKGRVWQKADLRKGGKSMCLQKKE